MKEANRHTQIESRSFFRPQRKVSFNKQPNKGSNKKEKNKLLTKADLNVQKMLSSMLYEIADEDNLNIEILSKLQQIDSNKKYIVKKTYESSSDISDSDMRLSPKHENKNTSQSITIIDKLKHTFSPRNRNKRLINSQRCQKKYSAKKEKNQFDINTITSLVQQNEGNDAINIISCDKESMNELNTLQIEIYNTINIKPKSCLKDKQMSAVYSSLRIMQEDIIDNNEEEDLKLSNIYDLNFKSKEQLRRIFKYHKPVYDSLSDEEGGKDELEDNHYCIEPDSHIKYIIDCIITIALLASFIYLPYSIAFKWYTTHSNWGYYLNCGIDFFFILDIIISFFAAYYDEEDQIVKDFNIIIINYLQGWFWLDLVSGLPYCTMIDSYLYFHPKSLFSISTYCLYSNNTLLLIHLIKCFRFLKTIKAFWSNSFVKFCMDHYFRDTGKTKWRMLYISLILYSACINLLACIFIFLGFHTYPNWIENNGLTHTNISEIYVTSIYFMITTSFTIGYGDIVLINYSERVFNVILLLFGIMSHSWVVTTLSSNFEYKEIQVKVYDAKLKTLEQIRLSYKGMPNEIGDKIKRFFKYNLEFDQFNPEEILELLPYKLRSEVVFNMYKHILNDFVFFKNFSDNEFKLKVILALRPIQFLKSELIISKGDFIEEMFFVKKGVLALEIPLPSLLSDQIDKTKTMALLLKKINSSKTNLLENYTIKKTITRSSFTHKNQKRTSYNSHFNYHNVKLIEIRKNEHFGDVIMFLNHRSPLQVKVESRTAELLLLRKTDALDISITFPKIWKKIISKSTYNWEQITHIIQKTLRFFIKNNSKYQSIIEKELENIIQNSEPVEMNDIDNIINSKNNSQERYKTNQNQSKNSLKDSNILLSFASQRSSVSSKLNSNKLDMLISNREEDDNDNAHDGNSNVNISLSNSVNFQLLSNHDDKAMNSSIHSNNSNEKRSLNSNTKSQFMCFKENTKPDSKHNKMNMLIRTKTKNDKALYTNGCNARLFLNDSSMNVSRKKNELNRNEINEELLPGEFIVNSLCLEKKNSYSNIKKFRYFSQSQFDFQYSNIKTEKKKPKNKKTKRSQTQHIDISINILKENNESNDNSNNGPSNLMPTSSLFLPKKTNDTEQLSEQFDPNILTFTNDELALSLRSNDLSYGDIFEKSSKKNSKVYSKNSMPFKLKKQNCSLKLGNELLDRIGQNIEQNAINLNHPSLFYTKTFNNMIEKEKVNKINVSHLSQKLKNITQMIKEND